jgi:hypothetical protein
MVLQASHLGFQLGKFVEQLGCWLAGRRREWRRWHLLAGDAPLRQGNGTSMQSRQVQHLLPAQALDPPISGMSVQRHLGEVEPVAQGFGIDAQHRATVGQGNGGHEQNSFREKIAKKETRATFPGISLGERGDAALGATEQSAAHKLSRISLPRASVWYGSSWHSCDASVATRTKPRAASHCLEEAR